MQVENSSGSLNDSDVILPKPEAFAEGSISGLVMCSKGPVQNATVRVGINSTFTDQNGNFLLEHVKAGIVELKTKPTTPRLNSSVIEVEVQSGVQNTCSVFLEDCSAVLEGVITDKNGKLIADAEVYGTFLSMGEPVVTKSDESGHYTLRGIPWGSHFVKIRASGYVPSGVTIKVNESKTLNNDFTLESSRVSISGKLLNTEGSPIAGELTLLRKGIAISKFKVSASSDGTFAFPDLAPDDYVIALLTPGYYPNGWSGRVEKAEMVNFNLPPEKTHWRFTDRKFDPRKSGYPTSPRESSDDKSTSQGASSDKSS